MVTPVIVVLGEAPDLGFEITGQIIVFEQNAVLERLVPALDLALGLRMARGAANQRVTLDPPDKSVGRGRPSLPDEDCFRTCASSYIRSRSGSYQQRTRLISAGQAF